MDFSFTDLYHIKCEKKPPGRNRIVSGGSLDVESDLPKPLATTNVLFLPEGLSALDVV